MTRENSNRVQDPAGHVDALLASGSPRLAGRVVEIVDRQRELFEELETMAEQQRTLIEERSTEALLAVLSRRSGVVQRLDRVDAELRPFRARWGEVLAGLDDAGRAAVQSSVQNLEQVARRVAERDEQDRQRMESERDRIARELASVRQGTTALHAYGPGTGKPEPRFHDREG